jgi:hypothetical protein
MKSSPNTNPKIHCNLERKRLLDLLSRITGRTRINHFSPQIIRAYDLSEAGREEVGRYLHSMGWELNEATDTYERQLG